MIHVLRCCPHCGNGNLHLLDDKKASRVCVVCPTCRAVGGAFRYGVKIGRSYREGVRLAVQSWNTAEAHRRHNTVTA